jgi:hypothetical protein
MAAKSQPVVGVDEGSVFTGPNPDGVYMGPVEGEDRAGVFQDEPLTDDGIVLQPGKGAVASVHAAGAPAKAPSASKMVVFTNTRFPEQSISIVEDVDGVKQRTGYYADFHSTKLMTDDPVRIAQIEALDRPYIYREPDEFLSLPQDSEKFFRHRDSGFKTLVKAAFEDWVDNSEWAARPQ